ncbi:hypothetical protein BGZ81_008607, partial [Podila clonocystis]
MFDEFEAGLHKINRAGGLELHRLAGKCLAYDVKGATHSPWRMNDVKVEIAASNAGESFEGGAYSGRCAKIVRATLQNLTEDSMCVIKLILERKNEEEEVVEKDETTLPLKYLLWAEPTNKGSSVKVVVGKHRGTIGKLLGLGAKGVVVQLRAVDSISFDLGISP